MRRHRRESRHRPLFRPVLLRIVTASAGSAWARPVPGTDASWCRVDPVRRALAASFAA